MSLFDFFEQKLDAFLKDNPQWELDALAEQLREQEEDTLKLIYQLQLEEKNLQQEILKLADEIQVWHKRINIAKNAGELDLVQAAEAKESALFHKGNQVWGKMLGTKNRIEQTKNLYKQVQNRHKEVLLELQKVKQSPVNNPNYNAWNTDSNYGKYGTENDILEQKFKQLEIDQELEQLKRKK
jgi:uncharacterized protein (TIGR04376 family)